MPKRTKYKSQENNKIIKQQIQKDVQSIKRLVARIEELSLQIDSDSSSVSSESTTSQASSKDLRKEPKSQGVTSSRFNFRAKRNSKKKAAVTDHLGNIIRIGDYVKSIAAPFHNGTVEKVDKDWVYINTSNTLTLRKKAPYNVIVQ